MVSSHVHLNLKEITDTDLYLYTYIRVEAFEASKYPITNREFYQFVLDGGYETPAYWSEEGWSWVKYKQAKHPVFWVCHKGMAKLYYLAFVPSICIYVMLV